MIRRLYIQWKKLRGEHVIAEDCWCKPARTSYVAHPKPVRKYTSDRIGT